MAHYSRQKALTQHTYVAGFTLIELMVVISVIGFLAAFAAAYLNEAREKARITRGVQFAASIYHSLGSEAVGVWNFDEGSGSTVIDGSGYGNNGAIYGAVFSQDTPYNKVGSGQGKYSLNFDGVNDYINCGNSESFNFSGEITVSHWIYFIEQINSYPTTVSKSYDGTDWGSMCWAVGISANKIRFGTNGGSYASNTAMDYGKWYHVVFVAGDNLNRLYINGQLDREVDRAFTRTSTQNIVIGNRRFDTSNKYYYTGKIDDVRIYSQALSASEIQKQYAEGLKEHSDFNIAFENN